MQRTRPILLLTRPEAAARRFADQVRVLTSIPFDAVISPLMRIEPVGGTPDLSGVAGVILTSAHAVPALAAAAPEAGIPVYAVGDATAQAACAAGFAARSADGDADALVAMLAAQGAKGPLFHLRGRHSRGDVTARLTALGIATQEAVVYDQVAQPLSDTARAALDGDAPVILPLFSPRSAALASDAVESTVPLHLVSISPATDAAAGGLRARTRMTVPHPEAVGMAKTVAGLLDAVSRLEGPRGSQ